MSYSLATHILLGFPVVRGARQLDAAAMARYSGRQSCVLCLVLSYRWGPLPNSPETRAAMNPRESFYHVYRTADYCNWCEEESSVKCRTERGQRRMEMDTF
jgi:hypothetical protein